MLSRVEYSEWNLLFPKIGFALFAIAFCVAVWLVLRTPRTKLNESSRMPLDDE